MSENPGLVLVIEDEAAMRRFLRASLAAAGFRVAEAENGDAGLKAAPLQPPDVVILDLGLPDMDGLEVIRNLRTWSEVPIVVVSARGQEKDKVAALDLGADDYLTKPFSVGELLARIRVAMRHAARIAAGGVRFTTVHGSRAVMRAAVEGKGASDLKLLAVTVLTSFDLLALKKIGVPALWSSSSRVSGR